MCAGGDAWSKYLECELFSVVKEHEYGHLEGGHLKDVLACV